jgi:hypothetical protein
MSSSVCRSSALRRASHFDRSLRRSEPRRNLTSENAHHLPHRRDPTHFEQKMGDSCLSPLPLGAFTPLARTPTRFICTCNQARTPCHIARKSRDSRGENIEGLHPCCDLRELAHGGAVQLQEFRELHRRRRNLRTQPGKRCHSLYPGHTPLIIVIKPRCRVMPPLRPGNHESIWRAGLAVVFSAHVKCPLLLHPTPSTMMFRVCSRGRSYLKRYLYSESLQGSPLAARTKATPATQSRDRAPSRPCKSSARRMLRFFAYSTPATPAHFANPSPTSMARHW